MSRRLHRREQSLIAALTRVARSAKENGRAAVVLLRAPCRLEPLSGRKPLRGKYTPPEPPDHRPRPRPPRPNPTQRNPTQPHPPTQCNFIQYTVHACRPVQRLLLPPAEVFSKKYKRKTIEEERRRQKLFGTSRKSTRLHFLR